MATRIILTIYNIVVHLYFHNGHGSVARERLADERRSVVALPYIRPVPALQDALGISQARVVRVRHVCGVQVEIWAAIQWHQKRSRKRA